jgi:hypothetical protein
MCNLAAMNCFIGVALDARTIEWREQIENESNVGYRVACADFARTRNLNRRAIAY